MKKTIIILTLITVFTVVLVGCGAGVGFGGEVQRIEKAGEESMELAVPSSLDSLNVTNVTGNISIYKTNVQKIKVKLLKKAAGFEVNDVERVLKQAKIGSQVSNGKIDISVVTDAGKGDFWDWKSNNYSRITASMELLIEIPRDLKKYTVNNVTGDVYLEGLSGSIQVEETTGNISLANSTLMADNSIRLITGDIDIDAQLDNMESLNVENTTGNVSMKIPSNSKISLDARVTTGIIGGNFDGMDPEKQGTGGVSVSKELNGGGKKVSMHTVTGCVYLNKK
ncbi:MAG TPA: DUF4097 family beta strand repeat-containing protein [Pseudobacteroides sp.]|uniref:DUF4097 family beta strand repeat-containing protein n=1 Tax=Pseudobacteroides sp. TaxID=1968840 RepID=UPI002F91EA9E